MTIIMKKGTAAATMKTDIPAEEAAEAPAEPVLRLQAAMWERPAVLITEVHLMMELSLILLMTGENLWNLSVVPAR